MSLDRIVNVFRIKYGDTINELRPKIKEFIESFSNNSDVIIQTLENEDFKKVLQNAGLVGSSINLAISFYETISSKGEDDSYYINKIALHVYKEVSKFADIDLDKFKLKKTDEKRFLESLFTKTSNQDYIESSIYAHPVIIEFKNALYDILKDQNEQYKWIDFVISYDVLLYEKIKRDTRYEKIKEKWKAKELIYKRKQYFKEVLDSINEKSSIDKKYLFDYYIENRLLEIDQNEQTHLQYNNNIKSTESLYEALYNNNNKYKFEIDKFLNHSEFDNTRFVIAPFGNGKTSFAKHIVRKYIEKYIQEPHDRWFPIYLPLKIWNKVFYEIGLEELIKSIIKPKEENLLLICDGLDEYSKDKQELLREIDNIISKFREGHSENTNISVNKYKKIVTTRPEAHPHDVKKHVIILPFSPSQVDEFFLRYGIPELNWKTLEKYKLKDNGNYEDLLRKPLFCWMFAIAYKNKDLEIKENEEHFHVLLYSSFIHSILKGRPLIKFDIIQYEKWILRKIAALKAIYKEKLTVDMIKEKLEIFAKGENDERLQKHICNSIRKNVNDGEEYLIDPILTSYFRISQTSSKHVDFMHKSFEEYLLAEYIIECIIQNKEHRLNLGIPIYHPSNSSNVTIDLLDSLLKVLKSDDPKYNKFKIITYNSVRCESGSSNKNFETLVMNTKKVFESGKNIIPLEELQREQLKPLDLEIWRCFYLNLKNYKLSVSYLVILLYILKKLKPEYNPINLKEFMENIDWNYINTQFKYFPNSELAQIELSSTNLKGANFAGANLSEALMIKSDLSEGITTYPVKFIKTDLSNAILTGAQFQLANLSGANLSGANLSWAGLIMANLSDSTLDNSILFNSELKHIVTFQFNSSTSFKNAITDNQDLLNYLHNKIPKDNLPHLYLEREDVMKELQMNGYSVESIENLLSFSQKLRKQ